MNAKPPPPGLPEASTSAAIAVAALRRGHRSRPRRLRRAAPPAASLKQYHSAIATSVFYFDLGSPTPTWRRSGSRPCSTRRVRRSPSGSRSCSAPCSRASTATRGRTATGRAAGLAEVERRAQAYGLPPIRWPDPFPGNMLFAMRAATFAKEIGRTAVVRARRVPPGVRRRPRPLRARQRLPRRGLVGAPSALAHRRRRPRRDQAAAARGDRARRRPRGQRRAERRRRRRGLLGRRPARGRGAGRRCLDSPAPLSSAADGGRNGEGVGADDRALEARAGARRAGSPRRRRRSRTSCSRRSRLPGALGGGPVPPRALAVAACGRALAEHPRAQRDLPRRPDRGALAGQRRDLARRRRGGGRADDLRRRRQGPAEIEAEIAALAERAREGGLRAPELSGATFTVVDLTGTGVRASAPIVVPGPGGRPDRRRPGCGRRPCGSCSRATRGSRPGRSRRRSSPGSRRCWKQSPSAEAARCRSD